MNLHEQFLSIGYEKIEGASPDSCKKILDQIKGTRTWGKELFLSEEEFLKQENRFGTNPKPGRNVLEKVNQKDLQEIESKFSQLESVVGPDYSWLLAKAVCGVPDSWLPDYVRKEIEMVPVPNLGAFIKPEYRDITYFRGIDYHQDIIDYKDRIGDFITAYVYLDNVTENLSPLKILPNTHKFGADVFPHSLKKDQTGNWVFTHRSGKSVATEEICLMGLSGDIYFWNAYLLHGTAPNGSNEERISLRYLIQPKRTAVDRMMDLVDGNLTLSTTRVDVDDKHTPIMKGNSIR